MCHWILKIIQLLDEGHFDSVLDDSVLVTDVGERKWLADALDLVEEIQLLEHV